MSDTINIADWNKLRPVSEGPFPNEALVASASTIAPTTYHSIVTGTTSVNAITIPYAGFSGTLAFTFTSSGPGATTVTTGTNIAVATTVIRYKTLFMTYNQANSLWYPSYT